MNVLIEPTEEAVIETTTNLVSYRLAELNWKVVGIPGENLPVDLYASLSAECHAGNLDFSDIIICNQTEFLGIPFNDPISRRFFLEASLYNRINVKPSNILCFNGMAEDPQNECGMLEEQIHTVGGIKLQLLGLGPEGQIGFNEPGSAMESPTRCVTLSEQTRENLKQILPTGAESPHWAYTRGMGPILDAEEILLIATGTEKAEAVRRLLEEPISHLFPASFLQLEAHISLVLDEAAASKLQRRDLWDSCHNTTDHDQMMDFLFNARKKAWIE